MVLRNEASTMADIYHAGTSFISGGMVQVTDASTTAATAAGFYIESYAALPNFYIYKPATLSPRVYLSTNLTIRGDITISNGTILSDKYPGTPVSYQDINLTGNWTNNGTFQANALKTVTLNGTSAQTIGGTASTTFNSLIVNNSSGATLAMPAIVGGILTLGNGNLFTDATNILSMTTSSSVGAVSNSGFVYGPMEKTGSTNFTFPVGKDLEYRPIGVSALTGSETFHAEYFHTDPDPLYSRYSKDPTLDHLDGCEYWICNRLGTVDADVTLSWDTYSCGVTSLPDLSVARWDGTMWKDHGNGGTTGTTSTGTIVSLGNVTSFSPFTLSSTLASENPLPIELLSFDAHYNGTDVNLNWATSSEHNNNFFTVERSADGQNFYSLKSVTAAGNSDHPIDYAETDKDPLMGTSYYRLMQTDYDGASTYSNIVPVTIGADGFAIVNTYATDGALDVTLMCENGAKVVFELFDVAGKRLITKTEIVSGNHSAIPVSILAKGIYLLKAQCGAKVITRKIVI
jgi:hypothetical protein